MNQSDRDRSGRFPNDDAALYAFLPLPALPRGNETRTSFPETRRKALEVK